ncbi:cytochrome P450 [Actinocorallia populi]|uniref:cytochrome P450 n=1 Tax=Actinocorallia populi TaxID=2079200 RepID=UPI001300507E|nr:cytochrome P450 [Actinocorallia populi]
MTATAFEINDPSVIDDPYPHYARLRENAPVHHDTALGMWVLSRHEDVAVAVRDATRFSSDLGRWSNLTGNPFNPSLRIPRRLASLLAKAPGPRVLLTTDPPDHTALRRRVSPAFTPRRIAALEPRIRQIAESLVDGMCAADPSRPGDLVRDLASPLPTLVIAEMMGIPSDRVHDFKRWSDDLVNGLLTDGGTRRMLTGVAEISWFFTRTIRRRRKDPGDDLISLLVAGEGDDALTTAELVTFCVLLLVAGNETTTNLVSNAMAALLAHPEAHDRLRADPGLAAAAVEETLRYDAPGQGLLRETRVPVTFGDVTIPAGQTVLTLIASANRDPRHHTDPDTFLLERDQRTHLAFGTGIHFCIGHALARLESRVAIETLYRRLPDLAPAAPPTRINSPVLRGLRTFPVTTGTPRP